MQSWSWLPTDWWRSLALSLRRLNEKKSENLISKNMVVVVWLSGSVRIVHVARLLSQIEIKGREVSRRARAVHDCFTGSERSALTCMVRAIADNKVKLDELKK